MPAAVITRPTIISVSRAIDAAHGIPIAVVRGIAAAVVDRGIAAIANNPKPRTSTTYANFMTDSLRLELNVGQSASFQQDFEAARPNRATRFSMLASSGSNSIIGVALSYSIQPLAGHLATRDPVSMRGPGNSRMFNYCRASRY
jgi:hypothetical protein